MSDTVVDIESMRFEGYVTVFQADPLGMIAAVSYTHLRAHET